MLSYLLPTPSAEPARLEKAVADATYDAELAARKVLSAINLLKLYCDERLANDAT